MLKRLLSSVVVIVIICGVMFIPVSAAEPIVSAESAVVMVAATGEVLFEKNAYEKRGMASTTKIMTCITAMENITLNTLTVVSAQDVAVEGTSMGLKAGDEVSLYTLLNGMLLESGNDAANATATLVAGGKEAFAQLMNNKAIQLGMNNTCFKNPSGLTEQGHYSCAYDMALLGSYAIKNSTFKKLCSTSKYEFSMGETTRILYNHNKLLSKYDGAVGIKTGFTKAAGRCLVSAVEKNGIVLVAVTLNAYDDWNDHIKLYNYCFPLLSVKKTEDLLNNVVPHVVNSTTYSVNISLSEEVLIPYKATVPKYTYNVYMPRFLYAPIKKGDYVGWVDVYTPNDVLIKRVYIVCTEDIQVKQVSEETFLKKLIKFIAKDRR